MTLLDRRIKSLSGGLFVSIGRLAKDVSPKYVHRLRTTVRRIESLLAYTHPDLSKKQQKATDDLVGLRKRAGRIRDLDVQMELLGAIANRSTAGDRKIVMDLLKRQRTKQTSRFQEEISVLKASKFRSHMKRITAKAADLPARPHASEAPLEQARLELSGLSSGFGGPETLKPSVMHGLRIQIKKMRYLAELGEASAEQGTFLNELKSVQDALGAWHDWEALAKTAEHQFGDRVNCPLLVEVQALLAAKYLAAKAAVTRLLSTHSIPPARQQHGSASALRALAKPA
jgi:CHAD domain-containing protein